MTMLNYIGKNTIISTFSTTAEVNLSNPTQESHGLNQSDTLRNIEDSSFPFAAVVVPVLIGLVVIVVLVLGYKFRDTLRDRIYRNSQENRNSIDLTGKEAPDTSAHLNETDQNSSTEDLDQANKSVLPLMTQENGV